MRPLLIDNYDSYSFNLYHQLADVFGCAPLVLHNDELSDDDLHFLLDSTHISCVILSPGPGSPDHLPDLGIAQAALSSSHSVPVLGAIVFLIKEQSHSIHTCLPTTLHAETCSHSSEHY